MLKPGTSSWGRVGSDQRLGGTKKTSEERIRRSIEDSSFLGHNSGWIRGSRRDRSWTDSPAEVWEELVLRSSTPLFLSGKLGSYSLSFCDCYSLNSYFEVIGCMTHPGLRTPRLWFNLARFRRGAREHTKQWQHIFLLQFWLVTQRCARGIFSVLFFISHAATPHQSICHAYLT